MRLAERYAIPHISTGEILRSAVRDGSELGRQVADILTKGSLVSDDLMTDLVRARLRDADTARGFVLDGFPRTAGQARALDDMVGPDSMIVVLIEVPDAEIVRRAGNSPASPRHLRGVCDAGHRTLQSSLDLCGRRRPQAF